MSQIKVKPADLVIIFGPPAVGKMTVGQELETLTGLRLFHNHMTIDLLTRFFPFGSKPFEVLRSEFRRRIIEEVARHPEYGGLIFTYVWSLDDAADKAEVDTYKKIIEAAGGQVYFVELQADFEERIVRNRSENRLKHKNKSNVKKTEETLRDWEGRFKMNSAQDFFYEEHHVKIDNTQLSPRETAMKIVDKFGLKVPK